MSVSATVPARAALASVALLLGLPAWAQDVDPELKDSWDYMQTVMPGVPYETLKAACDEGSLVIYHGTWADAQDAQIQAFRDHFPCLDVKGFGSATGERRERFLAEARAGRTGADIYQDTDVGTLNSFVDEGLVMEYHISNEDAFRPGAMKAGFWYPLRVALVGIAWNTDKVSDEDTKILSDWKGLTDPRWKGRAAVVDPRAGGVAMLPYYAWNQLYGEDFLKAVGGNEPRVIANINAASSALASGDVDLIMNASETGLLPLWERGAPIEWSIPTPVVGPLTGQIIPAGAPHPDAAKLYQEYSFTEEGYSIWQAQGGAGARKGLKDQHEVAAEDWYSVPEEMFDYDPAKATEETPAVIDMFDKDIAHTK